MNLSILDRLAVLNVLPAQGSYITLLLAGEIRSLVEFTSEEAIAAGLDVSPEKGASWKKELDAEIDLQPAQMEVIRRELVQLDADQKLTADHLGIYKKFIVGA